MALYVFSLIYPFSWQNRRETTPSASASEFAHTGSMEKQDKANILSLFQDPEERDLILTRLNRVSDFFNEMEDDPFLEMAHYKVLEAIDWYTRYCDECGYFEKDGQQETP